LDVSKATLFTTRPEPRQKSERKKQSATLALLSYNNYAAGTPADYMANLAFRDRLLEIEEKVHLGNLGSLRVGDREAWRNAVVSGTYDQQCDTLVWAGGQFKEKEVFLTPKKPAQLPVGGPGDERGNETKLNIRQLAAALLQLEQSVEPRYLQPPLGETQAEKSKKKTHGDDDDEANDDSSDENETDEPNKSATVKLNSLQRWELSLKTVTSFSQLFIHMEVLRKMAGSFLSLSPFLVPLCSSFPDLMICHLSFFFLVFFCLLQTPV
jgi:bromodomain adjacent to zinc finger domain protein 1A